MVRMLFANITGEWLDFPDWEMLGRSGSQIVEPEAGELIPLPQGATLVAMPGRYPIGKNPTGYQLLNYNPYKPNQKEAAWAVGALLPQGFTRTLLPAVTDTGPNLPLLGYAAVGIKKGRLVVAAIQTDEHCQWHPKHYNTKELDKLIKLRQKQFPGNSLINQLALCAREYGCFTAQNIFYGRLEGGLPVSPVCNANCLGCISQQAAECCPAPQRRLVTPPQLQEVAEVAANHLANGGPKAIVSFGQGCEGEPSLQSNLIAQVIKKVRQQTKNGTININTNAGYTEGIKEIVTAGIDSLRVSLISPNDQIYTAYHRPMEYNLQNVKESMQFARAAGTWVSLNLLTYPGLNDREEEIEALVDLVKACDIQQIQLRNLNIDPKVISQIIPEGIGIGIPQMLQELKIRLPRVVLGNYSRPVAK